MHHSHATSEDDAIEQAYRDLLGEVPVNIEQRRQLAHATGRDAAFAAIEALRAELIDRNPPDRRTQQLVHFAMLVARGERSAGQLRVLAAIKAGVTLEALQGVAETAAVVCGMPGYSLAVELISDVRIRTALQE